MTKAEAKRRYAAAWRQVWSGRRSTVSPAAQMLVGRELTVKEAKEIEERTAPKGWKRNPGPVAYGTGEFFVESVTDGRSHGSYDSLTEARKTAKMASYSEPIRIVARGTSRIERWTMGEKTSRPGLTGYRKGGTVRRSSNPRTKAKGGKRWGVYVKDKLAYASRLKTDANRAASKLKLSGRAYIKIKQVGPNPVSGKLPKEGWRKEFAKAAYAAVRRPKKQGAMARATAATRRTLDRTKRFRQSVGLKGNPEPGQFPPSVKYVAGYDGNAKQRGFKTKAEAKRYIKGLGVKVFPIFTKTGGRFQLFEYYGTDYYGPGSRTRNPVGGVRRRSNSSMSTDARELLLYIENDGDLYRQQHEPIFKNLINKVASGKYNKTKAKKLMGYLVESGAKKYNKEFGDGTASLKMFPKTVRSEVAAALVEDFEDGAKLGHFDEHLYKKYGDWSGRDWGKKANPRRRANATYVVWHGNAKSGSRVAAHSGTKRQMEKVQANLKKRGHTQVWVIPLSTAKKHEKEQMKDATLRGGPGGLRWRKNAASVLRREANPRPKYSSGVEYVIYPDGQAVWGLTTARREAQKLANDPEGHGYAVIIRTSDNKTIDTYYPSRRNPSFRGKLGTGTRFSNCVKKTGSAAVCASIGRKKYGKKGFAKLSAAGRRKNPSATAKRNHAYVVYVGDKIAWVGKRKSDAAMIQIALMDAGRSGVKAYEAKISPDLKMGWRAGMAPSAAARKSNPASRRKSKRTTSNWTAVAMGDNGPLTGGSFNKPWRRTKTAAMKDVRALLNNLQTNYVELWEDRPGYAQTMKVGIYKPGDARKRNPRAKYAGPSGANYPYYVQTSAARLGSYHKKLSAARKAARIIAGKGYTATVVKTANNENLYKYVPA